MGVPSRGHLNESKEVTMKLPSLEQRLNTRIDAGIAIYLIVFSLALGLLLVRGVTREFDRGLIAKAEGIIQIARQEIAQTGDTDSLTPRFEGMDTDSFAIWLSDGTLIGAPDALQALDVSVEAPLSDEPRFSNLELRDGTSGRKVEIDFVPRREGAHELLPSQVSIGSGVTTATLVVTESRQALNRQILEISLLVVGACALLLVSLAMLVHSSLRRGLAPVIGLRRQVELLGPNGNVHRVSLRNPPEELAPVLAGINELLQAQRSTDRREVSETGSMARAS